MQTKYQIFVSSTFRDLIDERQDALKSILDLGHIPAGMEGFPAIDMEQLKYIKKVIDECDYYVLIIGARYGSTGVDGISFTEKEYEYAVESGKVVLAFVHEDTSILPMAKVETDPEAVAKLAEFRSRVVTGRIVREWQNRESLKYAILTSLVAAISEQPAVGWIRASAAASEDLLAQINELRLRNEELLKLTSRLKSELKPQIGNIASLDAPYQVQHYYLDRGAHRNGYSTMTWRQIFSGVGPDIVKPRSPAVIAISLSKFMEEKRFSSRKVFLQAATVNQIKIQLSALGLIRNFQGNNTEGAISEWIQITELGSRILYETMVIKASGANVVDDELASSDLPVAVVEE
ncbi:DUF4062 domain-containing protein [Tardiphaga sp. vice304]|uniref:DUF4062 domain-containing protein n=1 Tax=Tardiphaga sp. vice304 TaxID=2592817 RepID=UPI0011627852|nr:DUF4062 domain-containing protein [Tardiphaga sp. vice304]QDM27556.1 DUF4062 domain-containing protein [Tardiphaga sp. vice304]